MIHWPGENTFQCICSQNGFNFHSSLVFVEETLKNLFNLSCNHSCHRKAICFFSRMSAHMMLTLFKCSVINEHIWYIMGWCLTHSVSAFIALAILYQQVQEVQNDIYAYKNSELCIGLRIINSVLIRGLINVNTLFWTCAHIYLYI